MLLFVLALCRGMYETIVDVVGAFTIPDLKEDIYLHAVPSWNEENPW